MRNIILLIPLLLFITGCNGSNPEQIGELSPEQVTLGFFKAIYVDKDAQKAKEFVDEPLQELIEHYYIAASVQRHMLALSMSEVTMEIDEINIDFFRKFSDDVTVVVKLKGLKGGSNWIDDRTVRLHKMEIDKKKKWVIVEIVPEKFKVNG